MSINAETKQNVVKEFHLHEKDTGSADVQIAILTERIKNLSGHFQIHKKDNHSKRGFMALINKRKRLLNYLRRTDIVRYQGIIQRLGLRK